MKNILQLPGLSLDQELVHELLAQDKVRVERIVSSGQTTDWLDQCEAEWVVLISGQATIEYQDGRLCNMQAGDYVYLAPHEVHRVAYTSSEPMCIWLCFFWHIDTI